MTPPVDSRFEKFTVVDEQARPIQPAPHRGAMMDRAAFLDKNCPREEVAPYIQTSADDLFKMFGHTPEHSPRETFVVGGETLGKSAVMSRMQRVFAQLRDWCTSEEAAAIEKSIKVLDLVTFGELVEPVLARRR